MDFVQGTYGAAVGGKQAAAFNHCAKSREILYLSERERESASILTVLLYQVLVSSTKLYEVYTKFDLKI